MQKKILVIDDERLIGHVIKRVLKGYEVVTVNDASEAVALLEENRFRPDLIITDRNLPTIDGDVFIAKLHALSEKTPIIVMSGQAFACEHAAACLDKPFGVDVLRTLVKRFTGTPKVGG